jgi:hypothetical protein
MIEMIILRFSDQIEMIILKSANKTALTLKQ